MPTHTGMQPTTANRLTDLPRTSRIGKRVSHYPGAADGTVVRVSNTRRKSSAIPRMIVEWDIGATTSEAAETLYVSNT